MIILDTNVLSACMLSNPDPVIVSWINDASFAQPIYTTAITIFEIEHGIQRMPQGKRRERLKSQFDGILRHESVFADVLDFDEAAALQSGFFADLTTRAGKTIDVRDIQIAGIIAIHNATLATRNTRDFEHFPIRVVNPWNS